MILGRAEAPPSYIPVPKGPFAVPPVKDCEEVELSLVLPTFREALNIQPILRLIAGTLKAVPGLCFEIIVVDDNSQDGTAQLALDESVHLPEVRVMRRVEESGLATAVIRGWQVSRGRVLAVMDADLQHPPAVLTALVQQIRGGADLAIGSRHVAEGGVSYWNLGRRIISRTAQLIGLIILPEVVGRISDPMSGYFMLRREVVSGRLLNPTGYKILIEVVARGNAAKIAEVGYVFIERRQGESKVSAAIYFQYFQHLCRLRLHFIQESRLIRFCLVGLSGMVVDMALLYCLSDPGMLGWGLTRSKVIAAEAAIVSNFIWNDLWTFRDLLDGQDTLARRFRRFLKFNAICLMGLALNLVILNILFNWFHMNRYVANVAAILAVTMWNYRVNRAFGWRSSH